MTATIVGESIDHVKGCPFCFANGKVTVLVESELAYATLVKDSPIENAFFIIPKRHCESIFELPATWTEEMIIVLELLAELRPDLYRRSRSFNINLNLGYNAGQRLSHLHFWVIPRDNEFRLSEAFSFGPATLIASARKRDKA